MYNLNSIQMDEVRRVFIESFQQVISNYLDESRSNIKLFVSELILREKSYMLLSYEGLPRLKQMVFGVENNRDFIFNLHFTFFSRWGQSDNDVTGLIANVARGVALSSPTTTSELNAMPDDFTKRLINVNSATTLLSSNKWILIILLIQLFVAMDESGKKKSSMNSK